MAGLSDLAAGPAVFAVEGPVGRVVVPVGVDEGRVDRGAASPAVFPLDRLVVLVGLLLLLVLDVHTAGWAQGTVMRGKGLPT